METTEKKRQHRRKKTLAELKADLVATQAEIAKQEREQHERNGVGVEKITGKDAWTEIEPILSRWKAIADGIEKMTGRTTWVEIEPLISGLETRK